MVFVIQGDDGSQRLQESMTSPSCGPAWHAFPGGGIRGGSRTGSVACRACGWLHEAQLLLGRLDRPAAGPTENVNSDRGKLDQYAML